jgi:hypothetical protein
MLPDTKISSGCRTLLKSRFPASAFCVVIGMKWNRRDWKSRLRSTTLNPTLNCVGRPIEVLKTLQFTAVSMVSSSRALNIRKPLCDSSA